MIVSGDPIPAPKAKELGIVDEIVDGDLLRRRRRLRRARRRREAAAAEDPAMDDKLQAARANPALFEDVPEEHRARGARLSRALQAASRRVQAAVTLPFDGGLKRERELFQECMASPQSKAQLHVFFAEREATKIPDVPPGHARQARSSARRSSAPAPWAAASP